jgi:cytochrome c-type protein NapC
MAWLRKTWQALIRPSSRYSLGAILIVGAVLGILFWGGFNWAMEMTNTEAFCISCHEMENTVYKEYKEKIHYSNNSGVRAICADCHVPHDWAHKVVRKIKASNELFHKIIGTIDTVEKFEAERLELAKHVWEEMEANDSRECRNCHSMEFMKLASQSQRVQTRHQQGIENNETCIDCHKGIAHKDVWKEMQQEKEQESEPDFDIQF